MSGDLKIRPWVTAEAFAEMVGRKVRTIRKQCRAKVLAADKDPGGRGWMVYLENLRAIKGHEGTPKDTAAVD